MYILGLKVIVRAAIAEARQKDSSKPAMGQRT